MEKSNKTGAIFYRPRWTCGRYNAKKHVALMYNLIAGYNYFFESYSADVVGIILSIERDGIVDLDKIAEDTGIANESLIAFSDILIKQGLLTTALPTDKGIKQYRLNVARLNLSKPSWMDKNTKEKLPIETSNAEQQYTDAIAHKHTITSAMFELTYNCSEMCIHCYNPGATRNNEEKSHRGDRVELGIDDYRRIIDELDAQGCFKVCLTGGDPFSKSIVWEIMDYLYQKEIAFDVFTNGQRITKDVERLANYFPRLIGVSIYSGIADDHDKITRIKGSWNRSIEVVKELANLAVPMNLKCCIMQTNLHSYYMVADIAKQYSAQPQFEINITESNEGDVCAKQLRLTEEQLQVVLRDNNLALYVGKEAPNFGGQARIMTNNPCGAGKHTLCITPEGNVHPCSAFPMNVGCLKTQTLSDILLNNILDKWIYTPLSEYSECGKYDYCAYCNLCAGTNWIEQGDFTKPAETNCFMAKARYNLAHKLMECDDPMNREQLVEVLQKLPTKAVELHRQFNTKG